MGKRAKAISEYKSSLLDFNGPRWRGSRSHGARVAA
jgi:hypothetical protein